MGVVRIVRQGAKYTPVIAAVVKEARGPVTQYAKTHLEAAKLRRLAVTKAASLTDGSVLPVVHGEQSVWVVFAGDQPVAQYPETGLPLAALVEHVDLARRRRPEEFPTPRERAAAAGQSAAARVHLPGRRSRRGKPVDDVQNAPRA
jgi:hypothetical protein